MTLRTTGGTARENVLSIRPFRRLWVATSLSSLGDWLSLVALTALAADLGGKAAANQTAAGSGVWLASLLPALLLGPLAGALADRFDRRYTMIVFDVVRAVLYLSIPLDLATGFVNRLSWIYAVQFLASCASLFWSPAKDASVPNLVPEDRLEHANQYSLFTTYGTAPVAGVIFSVLGYVCGALKHLSPYFGAKTAPVEVALYFNAGTFVVSALTVYVLHEIPKRQAGPHISAPSVAKQILEGWRFIARTQVVRGIVIGMIGSFAAAGVILALGETYIKTTLHGGNVGWGMVFSAVFVGLAAGMVVGLRILDGFSRRRLFGLSIIGAGIVLALIGLIPSLVAVVALVVLLGSFAGMAYVLGNTIVGREVDDDTRGRTFAFLQSAIKVILMTVILLGTAAAWGVAQAVTAVTGTSSLQLGSVRYGALGDNIVLLLAAVIAIWLGMVSYRHMDDRQGIPLRLDLLAALRGTPFTPMPSHANGHTPPAPLRGLLVAIEGGEGAGKTTQARLLSIWLREHGYDVVATHEPGATKIGMRLRALLLDTAHAGMSPKAEALLYAADRAEHVSALIRPALARGAVVVTDRYVDSSLAYQGRGRGQEASDLTSLNTWATGGLVPDLTVLLDLPPAAGLGRRTRSADRLEAEPAEFHQRVREGFRLQAATEPDRYLVLDASQPAAQLSLMIQERVQDLLPDPVPAMAEDVTATFPAIAEPTAVSRRQRSFDKPPTVV